MIRRVGFIGLGIMGKPMAMNIANAGFDLMAYDVRKEPLRELSRLGAKIARSAGEAAEHGELVEIAVLDDAQLVSVCFGEAGVLTGAKPGTMIAVHSTVLPKTLRALTESASSRNLIIVDAPISGGESGAYEKKLCYMVGGSKDAYENAAKFLPARDPRFFTWATSAPATRRRSSIRSLSASI